MAKSRINRKELRRLKRKQAFSMATQVRLLAEGLPNQEALRTCLLPQKDPDKRRLMYEYMKPFLKFESQYPSEFDLTESRIIRP